MINPSLKMASIAIGGVITGGVVGIYQMSQSKQEEQKNKPESTSSNASKTEKQTVATLLAGAKLILLGESTGDSSIWTKKWEEFKEEHNAKEPDGSWKIEGWNTKKENNEGLTKFKELCSTNSKVQIENNQDPLYIAVSKYCTKPMADSTAGQDAVT